MTGRKNDAMMSTTARDEQPDEARWDTMAEASAREGALGFGSAVDKDLDEDEYTTAEDDPDDALLGQPSEAGRRLLRLLVCFSWATREAEEGEIEEGRGCK